LFHGYSEIYFLGVPAAQSACYGLRYRFGAGRTMLTHALRMPNAGTQRVSTRAYPREG